MERKILERTVRDPVLQTRQQDFETPKHQMDTMDNIRW